MLRKKYFILLSAIGVLLLSTVLASAQIVNITGRVELEKENGEREAVAGALVEIYQLGTSANKSYTTDDKGVFRFVGVPPGSKYLLTVSGEGVEPVIVPISAGMENQRLTVKAGDGTRYTEEQVRNSTSGGGELTEDQKKELAELEKKRAEIEAKNKRAEEFNTVINRALEEGKAAFNEKNYDLAIIKFQEGFEAGPDFLGSAPSFLNSKALALKQRAVDNYNASVKSKDAAEKQELKKKAGEDFIESLAAVGKSLSLIETGNPEKVDPKIIAGAKSDALKYGRELVNLMIRTELAEDSVKEEAKSLINAYVEDEKDKNEKMKAQLDLGTFLTRVFDYDGAVEVYRKALEMDKKNYDALSGLGVNLYLASEVNADADQKQEGLNYMQYYLDNAPKDHSFRESVEGIVDDLKGQKMKPQKISMN